MATVTSLTAARMMAIEAASVVSGEVVGDDLILTTFGGSDINAGDVRGPTGSPGISSEALEEGLDAHIPIGSSFEYVGTVAPNANYLLMTGQTVVGADVLYPTLWSRIPASWKSGSNMILPDARKRVAVTYDATDTDFDAIGEVGGAKTHTLVQAELPNSTVPIDPPATAVTGETGNDSTSHVHVLGGTTGPTEPPAHFHYAEGTGTYEFVIVLPTGGPHAIDILYPGGGATVDTQAATHTNSSLLHDHPLPSVTGAPASNHKHPAGTLSVNIAAFNSGPLGSNTPHNNMQPYIVFQRMLKVL